ncbi:MAG: hypothetical protein D6763_03800 [Alphaproteobacteria bacterium]|nr:MAG: hypothetical protein D6763_03800 [Alphaproteobacteria bacterium]
MPGNPETELNCSEDDQSQVVRFLARPGVLGEAVEEVRTTHVSRLFFTATRVFKLKRAIRLPFLDFATPSLRRAAAEREVMLNRRTAPDIYLAVRAVTREPEGHLALDGTGMAVDWLVEMRRFDDRLLANRLAESGRFGPDEARALGELMIDFHQRIEKRPDKGGHRAMTKAIQDLASALTGAADRSLAVFAEELVPPLLRLCERHRQLLEDRRSRGMVRQCHGDMHLGNLCLIDGQLTAFDCIEFNDDIACVDVLYDLAFPVMDLVRFGHRRAAQTVFNRYMVATRDYGGLSLMPLFLAGRALVRTMAEGLAGQIEGARAYATLGEKLVDPPRPRLIAIGGLSGSGKSSVAYHLALTLAPGPGAVVLRSDEIRKRMFDVAPEKRLPTAAYSREASRTMYVRMMADAYQALVAGWPVVADATFMAPGDRAAIETVAQDAGAAFTGLWLDAPGEVLMTRVAGRTDDASDADATVVARQLEADVGEITWSRIDASGDVETVVAAALSAL